MSIPTQTSTRINHHLHKNKFQLDTHSSFDWIKISLISLGGLSEVYRHVWKCPQTDRLADMGRPRDATKFNNFEMKYSWGCWRSPSLLLPPVDMKPRYHEEAAWFILHPSCTSLAASDIWYKGWTWLDRKHSLHTTNNQQNKLEMAWKTEFPIFTNICQQSNLQFLHSHMAYSAALDSFKWNIDC